jgi:hypothetical protein
MIHGSAVMELSRAAGGASAEAEQFAGDYPPIWVEHFRLLDLADETESAV